MKKRFLSLLLAVLFVLPLLSAPSARANAPAFEEDPAEMYESIGSNFNSGAALPLR